jgi:hypothetical protein
VEPGEFATDENPEFYFTPKQETIYKSPNKYLYPLLATTKTRIMTKPIA